MGEFGTLVEIRSIDDVVAWVEHVYADDRLGARRVLAGTERGEIVLVETQVFVELPSGERLGGTWSAGHEVRPAEDVTNQLLEIANEARELHLGDLLGDLRRAGSTMTRWDFFAAPFWIELSDELRDLVT